MIITFGKHKGKSLELVVIKWPDYVRWMIKQENPAGPLSRLRDGVTDLVETFDAKPLQRDCHGCHRIATRCSVPGDNPTSVLFWCDDCDPLLRRRCPRGAVRL